MKKLISAVLAVALFSFANEAEAKKGTKKRSHKEKVTEMFISGN